MKTILAVSVGMGIAGTAFAGMTDLGNNWEAIWDSSLDGLVDIQLNQTVNGAIFIQKAAEFTQDQGIGGFRSIPIVFRQTGPSSITHIVIEDEIVVNSTGQAWTGFELELLDSGDASFNPALTLASGGGGPIGWSIAPFTTAAYSNSDTVLTVGGGILQDGEIWFPGDGVDDGELWINVNSSGGPPFTTFTLKETPIPGPAGLAMLAIGGLALRRRRR